MADIKSVFKKLYPMLGIALTATGGPVGAIAAEALGKVTGQTVKPEDASNVMAQLAATTDGALKLKEADQQFTATMTQLGYGDEEKLEELLNEDRANARNREIQVRDKTPEVGFYLLLSTTLIVVYCLFKFAVPADNKAIIFSTVGALSTLTTMAGQYFYGTTRGSQRQTELIAAADSINPGAVPNK